VADTLGADGESLDAIARELGISAERVRQLERSALRKLYRWCLERGLAFADLSPDRTIRVDLGEPDQGPESSQAPPP